MFFSGGVSLYDLPDWLTTRIAIVSIETATAARKSRSWSSL